MFDEGSQRLFINEKLAFQRHSLTLLEKKCSILLDLDQRKLKCANEIVYDYPQWRNQHIYTNRRTYCSTYLCSNSISNSCMPIHVTVYLKLRSYWSRSLLRLCYEPWSIWQRTNCSKIQARIPVIWASKRKWQKNYHGYIQNIVPTW